MPRLRFLARRLVFTVVLVAAASSAAMLLIRLAPGDAATELVGTGASLSAVAQERNRLGLSRSAGASFAAWAWRAVRLDFGDSYRYGRPVLPLVAERAANTAVLGLAALALATLVGVPLGIVATRRHWLVSSVVGVLSTVGLSLPPLILSILLAWLAARTGWFPVGGMSSAAAPGADHVSRAWDLARHLVVPALSLAVPLGAMLERLQARALAGALDEPWVDAARARGIPSWRIRWLHAARVAATPVAAVYGLIVGALLSGSFSVEIVTAWPGLGRLTYEALLSRDVNLVAGCAAASALFVALGVLLSDLALAWLDPRVAEGA